MTERRAAKRIPVTFHISFGLPSFGRQKGTISDLTLNGCRLESQTQIPVNSYLELWLEISPTDPRIFVDLAAVRWLRDQQLGVEFLSVRPEHKAQLQRIIQQSTE
jgi:hypothetical protein